MTECIVVFPSGVGVVPWMVPGGAEIAKATSELMKKYEAALASGDKTSAEETYKVAVKKIDQAVAKGLLHKNNAARKKSQYTVKLNKLGA